MPVAMPLPDSDPMPTSATGTLIAVLALCAVAVGDASAHGVSAADRAFMEQGGLLSASAPSTWSPDLTPQFTSVECPSAEAPLRLRPFQRISQRMDCQLK